jgi:hypothetical protein
VVTQSPFNLDYTPQRRRWIIDRWLVTDPRYGEYAGVARYNRARRDGSTPNAALLIATAFVRNEVEQRARRRRNRDA